MLYKNGSPYRLNEQEKKKLKEKFTFPLRMTYAENLIKNSTVNALPDQPRSINIPLRSTIRTSDGETQEWIWAHSTIDDVKGRRKYTPRNLPFMGKAVLTELDLELLYFLYHKSPHCVNGDPELTVKKKQYFMIEDLVKVATHKVNSKAKLARYEVMLNDDEIGLPESLLRLMAKAYFIPDVDKLHVNQVRVAIDISVKREPKKGIDTFMELSKSNEILTARSKIQTGIDLKLIYYWPKGRVWRWRTPDGDKPEDFCKVLAKVIPQNALIEWYNVDETFRERLDAELEGQAAMSPTDTSIKAEPGAEGA